MNTDGVTIRTNLFRTDILERFLGLRTLQWRWDFHGSTYKSELPDPSCSSQQKFCF